MISVSPALHIFLWFCATTAFTTGASAQNAPFQNAPAQNMPGQISGDAQTLPSDAARTSDAARNGVPNLSSIFGNRTGNVRLLSVDGPDLSSLRALGQSALAQTETESDNIAQSALDVDAISLGASLADLRADAVAAQALMQWVRDGGVVFLHNDAAQLFGYRTVAAREATDELAGQRFGRAEAALPLGLHPLLWGGASGNRVGNRRSTSSLLPGVRVVFYQMAPGDHLVVSHPTGVPLLEVTDLVSPQQNALYASCAAAYGRGWAVFTPYFVEQNRADGAAFVRNLLTLVRERPRAGAPSAVRRSAATWVAVPATTIDGASNNAVHSFEPADWVRPFSIAAIGWEEEEETANPLQTSLLITQREANGISRLLDRGRTDWNSRVRAQALLLLMRARLEWQRGNDRAAQSWVNAAGRVSSGFAETLLWRGIDALNNAEDLTLATADRVLWWRTGANLFAAALRAQTLLTPAVPVSTPLSTQPNNPTPQTASSANSAIAGVPRSLIGSWMNGAYTAATRAVNAPSSVEVIDDGASLLVLRHEDGAGLDYFAGDARRLNNASGAVGMWLPRQEIWVYPDLVEYNRFRESEGLGAQNLNPAYETWSNQNDDLNDEFWNGFPQDALPDNLLPDSQTVVVRRRASRAFLGDVQTDSLSTRLVTVAPRSPLPSIGRNINVRLSTESLAPLGELHGRALIRTMTQDGAPVPAWMEMGIALMTERQMADDRWNSTRRPRNIVRAGDAPERNLAYYNRQGWLLNAAQFGAVPVDGSASTVVKEQALGMMLYFYREFGAGAVVETLQRLGSGQNTDQALLETTGLSEQQFFAAWSDDSFGNADDNSRRGRRRNQR